MGAPVVFHKFARQGGSGPDPNFEHMKALTLAACHSQAKYSDYSDEQVVNAFATTTDMIFAAEASSPLFVVPLALILMNVNTITLTFTLPAGKGRKIIITMIEEAVKYLRDSDKGHDEILCETHGFGWITSSAAYNKFNPLPAPTNSLYHTYILRFNVDPLIKHDKIPTIASATVEQLKSETLIENANYEYVKENGGKLVKSFLSEEILTEEEMSRTRFDVRVGLLRAGQSQNPLGVHCDFFSPQSSSRLKILFVTNGYSETRLYTEPCMTNMADVKDWYKVVRQPEVAECVSKNYVVPEAGQPIQFSDRTLHEAKALRKEQIPTGSECVWRLMIRAVVYPPDRVSEVPKSGSAGVPQVYMLSEQEM